MRKNIVGIFIIGFLVLLSGCGTTPPATPENPSGTGSVINGNMPVSPEQQEQNIRTEALRKRDEKLCENMKNKGLHEECKNSVRQIKANIESKPEYCDMITQAVQRENCLESVTTKIAVSAKDIAKCSALSEKSRISCESQVYSTLAVTRKDISYCDKVIRSDQQERCKDNYYFSKAVQENKDEDCNPIVNAMVKNQCKNTVYLKIASQTRNPEICAKIEDQTLRSRCEKVGGKR